MEKAEVLERLEAINGLFEAPDVNYKEIVAGLRELPDGDSLCHNIGCHECPVNIPLHAETKSTRCTVVGACSPDEIDDMGLG